MRALKSLAAALIAVVMLLCFTVSSFAAYDERVYEDISEMYGTTLDTSMAVYVKFVEALGIVPSMTDGTFNATAKMTRAEALRVAYRMLHYDYDELEAYDSTNTGFDESGDLGDISDVNVLKKYIAWAEDYGFVNSKYVPQNIFEPDRYISGEEFLTLMVKIIGVANGDAITEDSYSEVLDILLNGMATSSGESIDTSSETLTREAAAVIVARAMVYTPGVEDYDEETFIYFQDYNNQRLDCLATNVYGCNHTSLTVRATKEQPMGYDNVLGDMLLSNGVQVNTGSNMTDYIGYPMTVVYLDKDGSGTFTEDEEMLTYEFVSPWVIKMTLPELTFNDYSSITGSTSQSTFSVFTNTMMYLNGELWPADEAYKLTHLIDGLDFQASTARTIANRPNMEIVAIQTSSDVNADLVMATEWIPGKIMTVTEDYISVYSFYDHEIRVYNDKDVEFRAIVNPTSGEYVDFYEAGTKMYVKAGNTVKATTYKLTTSGNSKTLTTDVGTYPAHVMAENSINSPSDLTGEVTVVLDSSKTTYVAFEETHATKEIGVQIEHVSASGGVANITARQLKSGETVTLSVPVANISTGTGKMDVGDFFTYYTTEGGSTYMYGVDPARMTVIEMDDYFITEGGRKYLKTEDFVSDSSTPYAATVSLLIDRFGGVWAVYGD